MNDTCATHRSRVPLRSSGRIKGGATTVEGERGPGQDFYLVFCVQQSSARGCCCSFAYVYFIKVFECSPVPNSFPIYGLCYNMIVSLQEVKWEWERGEGIRKGLRVGTRTRETRSATSQRAAHEAISAEKYQYFLTFLDTPTCTVTHTHLFIKINYQIARTHLLTICGLYR